jgi:glycerophosphoryl diester phosphodiesterase
MIDAVRGKAGIIPETKSPEVYGNVGLKMEKLLVDVLARNGLDRPGADPKTPVVIQSFSADSLKTLRRDHGCKLPLVFLVGSKTAAEHVTPEGLKRVTAFADGLAPNKQVVLEHPGLVKAARELGMSVTVWTFRAGQTGRFDTVRDEMAYFLRDLGVDAVFTDDPDQFPRD